MVQSSIPRLPGTAAAGVVAPAAPPADVPAPLPVLAAALLASGNVEAVTSALTAAMLAATTPPVVPAASALGTVECKEDELADRIFTASAKAQATAVANAARAAAKATPATSAAAKKTAGTNNRYFKPHGKVQFLTSNQWPSGVQGEKMKRRARKTKMQGVEIRELSAPHPIAGQQGLFATKNFEVRWLRQLSEGVGVTCALFFLRSPHAMAPLCLFGVIFVASCCSRPPPISSSPFIFFARRRSSATCWGSTLEWCSRRALRAASTWRTLRTAPRPRWEGSRPVVMEARLLLAHTLAPSTLDRASARASPRTYPCASAASALSASGLHP